MTEDERLKKLIQVAYERSCGIYGAPRIHAEPALANGERVSRKQVARLVVGLGLEGVSWRGKRRTRRVVAEMPAAPDLVRRQFTADAPNELWIADITYVPTWEGWLFLAVVVDACSRRVCGWSMRDDLKADLVVDALGMATTRRRPGPGLIHHSDRGGQYRSLAFGRTPRDSGILASMGSRGDAYDNAACESFMASIKNEWLKRHTFKTRDEARLAGFSYIEGFYNPERRHLSPGLPFSDRIREDAQGELHRGCSGLTENSQRNRGNSSIEPGGGSISNRQNRVNYKPALTGAADIAELNKILDRAVNLKNFLKADDRVNKVAHYVAEHYRTNVEPLGYKAFLVAVDRPACAKYKRALDRYLPPEYSAVVYTANYNDPAELKEFHLDEKAERQIRKEFAKFGTYPKILIVTEKLLTGYDAPVLYAMYLDKPMRDHTLLQAIARVNRPYVNETEEMTKPHGFVLDFVGIFDKLERALAFDSEEVNAIIKDLALLKSLFRTEIEKAAADYLGLIQHGFDDRDVDALIEYFRDKDRRKEFFRRYKELEVLYEIISPDAFLRPFMDDYLALSAAYEVVRKAYGREVYVDRAFQRKTNDLVQQHVRAETISPVEELVEIDAHTVELIEKRRGGDARKVINLVKSIEKAAVEESDDPFLVAMAERARAVQESFEQRQKTTQEALEALIQELEKNEERKKEQAEKGFDSLTFFVYRSLADAGLPNAEQASAEIREAFARHPNWRKSDAELRELRTAVTFAVFSQLDDLDQVTGIVDTLFTLLEKAYDVQ